MSSLNTKSKRRSRTHSATREHHQGQEVGEEPLLKHADKSISPLLIQQLLNARLHAQEDEKQCHLELVQMQNVGMGGEKAE